MNLKLRILRPEDVSSSYVNWFLNDKVKKFSDNQYRTFTYEGQYEYVKNCLNNPDVDLYGIFDGNLHVGNIAISGLESVHKRAEITYVVGETSYWGKGVGKFAISSIIHLAKEKYNLNKLFAGLSENNLGSKIILERNGFVLEGKRLKHLFYNGKFCNQLDYGLILKK